MKKFWLVFIGCLFISSGFFIQSLLPQRKQLSSKISLPVTPTASPRIQTPITQESLFVPYWTLGTAQIPSSHNTYIYFGVVPGDNGIDTKEPGFVHLSSFTGSIVSSAKTLLTVRMIDQSTTEKILSDKDLQQKVITDAITLAKQKQFSGIVLDLEYNAIAFESVVNSITNFSTIFADTVKAHDLSFYQTLYGDTFYRGRPYNVKKIADRSDGIFVMAYDFHKANGDPGPNFPLIDRGDGYDFKQMTNDFLKYVPADKITVVFGLFGYDWTVDEKGQSQKQAESLSTNQILQKFVRQCSFKDCAVNKNDSFETNVIYKDENGLKHTVWFEDLTSVDRKKDFLQTKGVSSIGFWANGYF